MTIMKERSYQKLIAWQKSHLLCRMVYKITKKFPSDERYGLVSQMRRSAYSVPMNIAEGNARRTSKEKSRFFEIALASMDEVHYQCVLAKDLEYVDSKDLQYIDALLEEVSIFLTKLRAYFQES